LGYRTRRLKLGIKIILVKQNTTKEDDFLKLQELTQSVKPIK
jgi:hypothetical protein